MADDRDTVLFSVSEEERLLRSPEPGARSKRSRSSREVSFVRSAVISTERTRTNGRVRVR